VALPRGGDGDRHRRRGGDLRRGREKAAGGEREGGKQAPEGGAADITSFARSC
jgi:hypothetical protein